ncbi:NADP-dependent malic enzyme, partial [bacterium]|nr:NADP-dependent malic enzyme [bacterium]
MSLASESLKYHSRDRKGKLEVIPTKPVETQYDLSLAYTPGVAEPCLEIQKAPDTAALYTARQNLVAVVSNGTAVLGLGNLGALASKPVMEGKAVLFKRFADIDVFDIELNSEDPEDIIRTCQLLEPTFGGINLEDISAPTCFKIEETLRKTMNIPVFHDDQHGTAIISSAGLVNALRVAKKDIADVRVVINGAGASGTACANMYINMGVKKENLMLCDSKGVIYAGREDVDPDHPRYNPYKANFARKTKCRTLDDAMKDADVFCGCSVANVVSKDMLKSMADRPIVFALANPDPEISYPEAKAARSDVILCTGRSDYPNQINNVLGFPSIFRGALDSHAVDINEQMKMAAAHALADLAMEDVPDYVSAAYGLGFLRFGPEYLIPKPVDHRVLLRVAVAVAKAARDSGVAKLPIADFEAYHNQLEKLLGKGRHVTRMFIDKARVHPKRIVFPEGNHSKILRAANLVCKEKIGHPILIGSRDSIINQANELGISLEGIEIMDPWTIPEDEFNTYVEDLWKHRQRKGITLDDARRLMRNQNYLGMMLLRQKKADALVAGVSQAYAYTVRPALQLLEKKHGIKHVYALYALVLKKRNIFLADAGVNLNGLETEDLAEVAILAADTVRKDFMCEPRVAMLSFSDFGSVHHPLAKKVANAVKIVKDIRPDIIIDGEMQADTAISEKWLRTVYKFSSLEGEPANTLIFPDITSANIAMRLLSEFGEGVPVGPVLLGMEKAVHLLEKN